MMIIGDLVVRKSYDGDVTFRVEEVWRNNVLIKGTEFRLLADSPMSDLVRVPTDPMNGMTKQAQIKAYQSLSSLKQERMQQAGRGYELLNQIQAANASYFERPGKVLHLDGDINYLHKSMKLYEQLRVPAEGYHVHESTMADVLLKLLPSSRPDILVITGHDGVLKKRQPYDLYSLSSYKNSQNFVSAIQVARQYDRSLDSLTIVAGACQSHFEALLRAGANFASSPGRILIHALDPVYVAAKAAFTSIKDTVNMGELFNHTISGSQGVGGVETRGSYRMGMPRLENLSTLKVTPSAI